MRVERARATGGGRAAPPIALAAACALVASPARPQGVTGNVQVQFQRVEQPLLLLDPDGTTRRSTAIRELWNSTFEVNHSIQPRPDLSVFSQLRLNQVTAPGSAQRSQTPYGTVRVAHPLAGLNASYRPRTVTGTISPSSVSGAPDGPSQSVTSKDQESVLSGYLAPARLPRMDATWVRRHRDRDIFGAEETGITRSARVGYELRGLNLRGGYGDLARETAGTASPRTFQRTWDGGAGFRTSPVPALSLAMDYDYSQTRHGESGRRQELTRAHAGTLTGTLRRSRRAGLNLSYALRRTQIENAIRSEVANQEGSLLYDYAPSPAARLTGGGGFRSLPAADGTGWQRYATALASAEGNVRPGWRGNAGASLTTYWDTGKRPYALQTFRAGSRFTLRRGLELNGDLRVSASSDSAARGTGSVTQGSAGVQAAPFRTLQLTYALRGYAAGSRPFGGGTRSRSHALDLRWRPLPTLELYGSLSRTGALPRNDPRVTTRQVNLQWRPHGALQLSGFYTRSDQPRLEAVANRLEGQEFAGGRVLAALNRSWSLNGGLGVANPGRWNESRQYDAALTMRFGR